MVQLHFLSGKMAGQQWNARRFPFQVGRATDADLTLDDAGIWETHLRIEIDPTQGALLYASPEAFTAVNGQPIRRAILRNGDIIEAGSVKMRFGFSPSTQYSLRFREIVTWVALGALCFGQVALIYWLLA